MTKSPPRIKVHKDRTYRLLSPVAKEYFVYVDGNMAIIVDSFGFTIKESPLRDVRRLIDA